MKKMFLIVTVSAVLSLTSVFAESGKIIQSLHLSVPIQTETWKSESSMISSRLADKKNNDILFYGVNLNWNRMTLGEGGFSFLFGMGLGATSAISDDFKGIDGNKGFNSDIKLGWGFAPLRSEKNILVFHGFFGFNFKYLTGSDTRTSDDCSADLDYTAEHFALALGIDALFIHRFSDSFGLMAGLDVSTTLYGFSFFFIDSSNQFVIENESYSFDFFGKVNFVPRIGVCWIM